LSATAPVTGRSPTTTRLLVAFSAVLLVAVGVFVFVANGPFVSSSGAPGPRTTVKTGNWSDPEVWAGEIEPQAGDVIEIGAGHHITYDVDKLEIAGMTVAEEGTLSFSPERSATLASSANVIVNGKLVMRPENPEVIQTLRFTGITENNFSGGGMDPIASDVGLWVMGRGQLELIGSQKSGWLRLAGGIAAGATGGTLQSEPVGWAAGDEIVIAPTEPPTVGDASWDGFDETNLTSVSGADLSWSDATARAHPEVNGRWSAEVANLTRNVRIKGTATGRTHVFIRSERFQTVNYVELRHVGPRHVPGSDDNPSELVPGRYGLHFHHSFDAARGSQVIGTVVHDAGNRAFVVHRSHGVTLKDTVSYDTFDDAYWWDGESRDDESHDVVIDHALAAKAQSDPDFRGYRLTGFALMAGLRNTIRDSVAVGIQGSTDASGFGWPEPGGRSQDHGVWNFSTGNMAHNNSTDGIFIWQNDSEHHHVRNFTAYHNGGVGIDLGAYANIYSFANIELYGNAEAAVQLRATTAESTPNIAFENMVIDGAGISDYAVLAPHHQFDGTATSTVFKNVTFKNTRSGGLLFVQSDQPDLIDFIDCNFQTPADVVYDPAENTGNMARIQHGSTATLITKDGDRSIEPFATSFQDWYEPQTSIVSPTGGASVTGAVTAAVEATDNSAISRVDFFVDGVRRGTADSAPYDFSWDTAAEGAGWHVIHSRAVDASGNSGISAYTSVFVTSGNAQPRPTFAGDTEKPQVTMWYPDANETFSGVGEVTLDVSDDSGIAKVELVTDEGVVLASTDQPPYHLMVPSWLQPDGDIWLQLVATDLNGNTAESNRAHIEIQNSSPGAMPADIEQPPPPLSGVSLEPTGQPSTSGSHTH
jgi:Bacterial Ig domain/G8 domain